MGPAGWKSVANETPTRGGDHPDNLLMRYVAVRNGTREVTVAEMTLAADTFWLRLRGLLGRPPLKRGEGLLLTPCKAVHMLAMRYPIDVAFLDAGGQVVGLSRGLAPGARSGWHSTARSALELPAGRLDETGTVAGDQMVITTPASTSG